MTYDQQKESVKRANRAAMLKIDIFLAFMAGCIVALLVWGN